MSFVAVAIGGMTALNQIQAGGAANARAKLNATAMDYQAKQEQAAALQTAGVIRKAGQRQVGQANAAFAGAGVQVGSGSAQEVEHDIEQNTEHDAFQALLDGNRRARGLQTNAQMTRIDGQQQQTAGYVNAVGTVLSSGYGAMKSNGWRSNGPGFSGTQAPAPVINRDFRG